jgi:hypothetical protein
MRIVTLAAALILLLTISVRGEQITTDQKDFLVSGDGRYVVLQGTWRRTSQRPTVEVPYVNSVRIECDRTTKICNEYVAKFIQKTDDPLGAVERPYLFLMKEQFRVIDWTGTTIAARAEPRADVMDLRISLTHRTAERSSRETAARGAHGANPQSVTQWVLQ